MRPGEPLRKLEDVPRARRTKPVDRLKVVADDRQPRVPQTQARDDVDLQPVHVLVLVNQHVIEVLGDHRADYIIREQCVPIQQQVIEIEHPESTLAQAVGAEDRGERLPVLPAPGKAFGQNLAEGPLRVDRPRVDVQQRPGAREAPAALGVPLLLAHHVQEIGGVAGVQDTETRVEPERGRVNADHAVSQRMKRATNDPARIGGDPLSQRARPLDHLPGRPPGERQQQDPFRRSALRHQPRRTTAQRRRLPRPGAGENQQRLTRVRRGSPLLDVELVQQQICGGVDEHPFAKLGHPPDDVQASTHGRPSTARAVSQRARPEAPVPRLLPPC